MPLQPGAGLAKPLLLKSSSQSTPFPLALCHSQCHIYINAFRFLLLTQNKNRFSDTYPRAHFVKLDVDEVPDVAQELGIRAMPTFLIFKDGEKVKEVVGANAKALDAAIVAFHPPEAEA
jgi:hypothetical protein